jgi:putative ABC transport system substrate-binding protein
MIHRRDFITLLGGAAAWPIAARAQQRTSGLRQVGVLMNGVATEKESQSNLAAFVLELRRLGWTEGQNLEIDVRWSGANDGLARTYAAQLIGSKPDVILAATTLNLIAARDATNTVPTVFVLVSDPVAQGFVESMTKPGGNITGFSNLEFSIGSKWLELLKGVAPSLTRVAYIFNPETSPQSKFYVQAIEAAALPLGVQVITLPVRTTPDIEPALATFAQSPNGGVMLPTSGFMRLHWAMIAELAARYRLPSIASQPGFVKEGGLMEYGSAVSTVGQFRQAASYVDRILKGLKAGDLPVQGADRYTFSVNLKAAKTLGIEVPQTLLVAADEVIE